MAYPISRAHQFVLLTFFLVDFVVLVVLYLCYHPFVLLILLYLCIVFFSCVIFYDVYFVFSLFAPLSSQCFVQWVINKLLLFYYYYSIGN